jgi:hypothetical protein
METPQADISRLIEALEQCASDFALFWEDQGKPEPESGHAPTVLLESMANLLELFYRYESEPDQAQADDMNDLNELADYGLTLLEALAMDTQSIGFPGHQLFEDMTFPLALWLARHGFDIETLGSIVNAMARMANRLSNPDELENLFSQSSEIAEAVSVNLTQDLEALQPGEPWPVFILNRGIIATRTLNPEMIETAFDAIVENMPELAQTFFSEAMEQMELLDYPPHVRAVVERYFNTWNNHKRLH